MVYEEVFAEIDESVAVREPLVRNVLAAVAQIGREDILSRIFYIMFANHEPKNCFSLSDRYVVIGELR